MKKSSAMSMALVVTGNLIGAGILALPVNTGLAGFVPALVGIVCMWGMMLSTALILAAQPALSSSDSADLPTFFQHELGDTGKWVTVIANMLILYGLLVAYLSGASEVLKHLLGQSLPTWAGTVLFFVPATLLSLFGLKVMAKSNTIFMVLMWCAFIVMIALCFGKIEAVNFTFSDWGYLPVTLPVVITGFHFHNVIPSVCRGLGNDQKEIRKALFLGTLIGLTMNLAWAVVVLGALPVTGAAGADEASLIYAFKRNLPATIPLDILLKSQTFIVAASAFALLAMFTSYITNGIALTSFINDLLSSTFGQVNRAVCACIAFLPPFAVAVVDPDLFLKALNIVGGVGIDLIFGILPAVLLIKYSRGKMRSFGWVLALAFGAILLLEIGQETGMSHLAPDLESWSAHVKK